MTALLEAPARADAAAPRKVVLKEQRLVVLDGSTVCPSREACDRRKHEQYETYVRRHAQDHGLGTFDRLEDAERNLFLWCFYFAAKYGCGNHSITPDPFWEHCVFMAEWRFNADDLEQGWEIDARTWRLPDYADMRGERELKRFKKIEKPRGSLKTSVGRAYVTWRLVRAYFVESNPFYRVLVISAASQLGRAQWFKPLKQLWLTHEFLLRIFGAWEFTCDKCGERQNVPERLRINVDYCPKCRAREHEFKACGGCDYKRFHREDRENELHCAVCKLTKFQCGREAIIGEKVRFRKIGLVTKGSFGRDSIMMRWTVNVPPGEVVGVAAENFMFGGVGTELTGQRFDLVMADDLSTKKNSETFEQRQKVEMTVSEVRAQLSRGQFILSCTRKHLDDYAGLIERKTGPLYAQFHIMSRRAAWVDKKTGQTVYYWPVDAEGNPRLDEKMLTDERNGNSERFFYSEYMNQPQDPTTSSFKSEWFEPIDDSQVPAPVLWGLGCDYTDEQRRRIEQESLQIFSFLYIDPAGHEEQKARNDDTAMFGGRIYRGTAYVALLRSFKGPDSKEKEEIYQAAVYLKPHRIRYERKNNDRLGALEAGFANFCREKSAQLSEALRKVVNVFLPMDFVPASTIVSKRDKIEKTEPLWRAGRVKILKSADPTGKEIAKLREQYVGLGITSHDDYPDAGSALQEDLGIPTVAAVAEQKRAENAARANDRGNIEVPMGALFKEMLDKRKRQSVGNWGVMGGGGGDSRRS